MYLKVAISTFKCSLSIILLLQMVLLVSSKSKKVYKTNCLNDKNLLNVNSYINDGESKLRSKTLSLKRTGRLHGRVYLQGGRAGAGTGAIIPKDWNPLKETCKREFKSLPDGYVPPIKCFHCRSNTSHDQNPACDTGLWKFLKQGEKAKMRRYCEKGELKGIYCMKTVKQKLGERITERGCYTDKTKSNKRKIKAHIGCHIFNQGGYRTTVCICARDYCNGVRKFGTDLALTIIIFIFIALVYFIS